MEINPILLSFVGGSLIGLSVTVMLLFNGRVTGISGILSSSFSKVRADGLWRLFFLTGLIAGGLMIYVSRPDFFVNQSERSIASIIVAGLLVGYGTVMGAGCTSGHGICGLSRLSIRSLIATLTFMIFGFLSVQFIRFFLGGSI